MEEVEKLKTANANLEQRKEELVKELEQVTKLGLSLVQDESAILQLID